MLLRDASAYELTQQKLASCIAILLEKSEYLTVLWATFVFVCFSLSFLSMHVANRSD